MKPEEAIEIVNGNFINVTLEDNETHSDAFERAFKMAKAALEKQIPKEPIHKDGEIICPNCLGALIYSMHSFKVNYCDRCGQAIDWSGEE